MINQRPACYFALIAIFAGILPAQVIRTESRVVLVDAVVTDRKGNYIHDLKQKDFRVWEDNKEQTINSFTFEADAASPANDRKHYLVLFFDNSSSSPQDQIRAREAAVKFIDSNSGANRLMAIVEFSGGLRVTQNFTEDADRLKKVVSGVKLSSQPTNRGPAALRSFAARNVLLALRDLAKGLAAVPGRKTLVFLSGGFPLDQDGLTELNATIDSCNRANVAVYPIDLRGLLALGSAGPRGALFRQLEGLLAGVAAVRDALDSAHQVRPAYFQKKGGTPPPPTPPRNASMRTPAPMVFPTIGGTSGNQMVLQSLASGTGGFLIMNSNDLLAGLEKIGKEQNEYYLLGYTPSKELEPGACHTIKVKVDQGGATIRARSGYCDVKPKDILAGTPTERDLETRVNGGATPTVKASMLAPFVYPSPGTARINLAMDIPGDALNFSKEKGKFHLALNMIGIVYLPDGGIAARFSDTVKRDYEEKKQVDFFHSRVFHYEKQFEVAPGKYVLKVAFSSGGENFGKLETPLAIEPFDNSQFLLSSLVLSKEARQVDGMSLGTDAVLLEDQVPLVVNGIQFMPASTNHYTKAERGFVYGELYEPAYVTSAGDPKDLLAIGIQMQIVEKKSGTVKLDSGLIRLDPKPQPGNPAVPFALKLDFTNLTAGSYRVIIQGIDADGHKFTRGADLEMDQ